MRICIYIYVYICMHIYLSGLASRQRISKAQQYTKESYVHSILAVHVNRGRPTRRFPASGRGSVPVGLKMALRTYSANSLCDSST